MSLALTCEIYRQAGCIPNWIIVLLPLSKRLHSIFVLRLFNDCWSVVAMQASVLAYQQNWDFAGTLLFRYDHTNISTVNSRKAFSSAALSVKMSILLYLPGLLVILVMRHGLLETLRHMLAIILTQVLLAWSFLRENPRTYLQSSFDLSRTFLYRWTVNWKLVDEATFLSPSWANGLLIGHVLALVTFGLFRWCEGNGGAWYAIKRCFGRPRLPTGLVPLTADCEFIFLRLCHLRLTCVFLYIRRCCNGAFYLEFDRRPICSVAPLSILHLVRTANSIFGVENALSGLREVRAIAHRYT